MTGDALISDMARKLWSKEHPDQPCPADHIPTPVDLAAWLPECPEAAHLEAGERLAALYGLSDGGGCRWRLGRIVMGRTWRYNARTGEPQEVPNATGIPRGEQSLTLTAWERPGKSGPGWGSMGTFQEVHKVWKDQPAEHRPKHPLAPLVAAWLERPKRVEADRRAQAILPLSLKNAFLFNPKHDRLPDGLSEALTGPQEPAQGQLPFMPDRTINGLVPVLPIRLYDLATRGRKEPGRGAPIAQRLFFETLLSVGRLDRLPGQTARLDVKLRALTAWLWPKGWDRKRDLPKLRRALIELHNMRVDYRRMEWALVLVTRLPHAGTSLDDEIGFRVEHLPGSERGPLIDRPALRNLGLVSAPAWRSFLRLAYLWDAANLKNKGRRIYATRPEVERDPAGQILGTDGQPLRRRDGRPIADWRHGAQTGEIERNPRADLVPDLGPDDLIRLAFDEGVPSKNTSAFRMRLQRARQAIRTLEDQGLIAVERTGGGGLRLLERWRGEDD